MKYTRYAKHFISIYKSLLTDSVSNVFSITIELLYKCNLRCKFCSRWKKEVHQNRELDVEVLCKRLYDLKKKYPAFSVSLTGGEPVLYSGFNQLLGFLEDNEILYGINTNAVKIEKLEKHLQDKRCNHCTAVMISLDSHTPAYHNKVRGVEGAFEKTIANIKRLKKFLVPVTIQTNLSSETLLEMGEYEKLAKKLGVNCRFQPIHENTATFKLEDESLKQVNNGYDELFDYIEKHCRQSGYDFITSCYYKMFPAFFMSPSCFPVSRCVSAARLLYYITPKGDMLPCEDRRDIVLGDIYSKPIEQIIRAEKARDFRRLCKHKEHGCFCLYACVARHNEIFRFFPVITEPYLGFLTRRKWQKLFEQLRQCMKDGKRSSLQ